MGTITRCFLARLLPLLAVAALVCDTHAANTNATLQYSGTVRDPSGAPAAGVRVSFYPGHYPGAGDYTEVKTDANGRYEIIQQQKSLGFFEGVINPMNSIMARDLERNLAAIEEFAGMKGNPFKMNRAAIEEFAGTKTNIDLTLQPGITLSGSVKNAKGAPVNDAEVDLRFQSGVVDLRSQSGHAIVQLENRPTKVDEQGSFSVRALPRGREYMIMGITAKGYGSAFGRVEAKNTQTNSYAFPTFVLKLADRKLAGHVLDGHGTPLAGAHVSFGGQWQPQHSPTNTDSKGSFVFDAVCDGSIKIFANYHDPLDSSIWMNLNGGGGMDVQGGDTNIVIMLRDTSISAWNVPTLTTTGTVFDLTEAPAPSVSLVVWNSANPFLRFFSSIDGQYKIRWQRPLGLPTPSNIKSVLVGRDPSRNLSAIHELDETTTNLDLHLQAGCTLSGSVQDISGMPLTNAMVSLHMHVNKAGAELAQTRSDANGSFSFNALPQEGEYSLDVTAPGYGSATEVKAQFAAPSQNLQTPTIRLTAALLPKGAVAYVTKYPKDVEASLNRSWSKYMKGDYDGAIADATQAIQLDPKDGYWYGTRAWSRHGKDDTAGAMEDCKMAIKLCGPETVETLEDQGLLDFIHTDYGKAVVSWEKAIQKDPSENHFLQPWIEKAKGLEGIHDAARFGNVERVKALLEANPELVNARDDYRATALHMAASGRHKDVVELLLAKGSEVNASDKAGGTPLFWAAGNGQKDVVELLLAKGADVNAKDNKGRTPLLLALEWGHAGYANVVELLVAKGANTNLKDNTGKTSLHSAAMRGNKEVVELLLSKGAEASAKDNNGKTPLFWAADYGHKDMVDLLLARGAEINTKDNDGKTPLHWAAGNGHKDMVELLLTKGAEINAKDKEGRTPLHIAVRNGNKNMVELLVTKGAEVNVKDNNGMTPLHEAAFYGSYEMVEWLLGKGAEVNAKTNNGSTPLHVATTKGYQYVADLLRQHGGTE